MSEDDQSMATLVASPEEQTRTGLPVVSSSKDSEGVVVKNSSSSILKHPTAVAMSAVFVCPPHEAELAKELVQEALIDATPFDQATAFALCGEERPEEISFGRTLSGKNSQVRRKKNTMSQYFTNREEIQKWGPPRFFVPHRVGVAGSAKPLIASETLMRFVHSRYFTPFTVIMACLATLCLVLGSFGIATGAAYWPSQYGAVLCFLLCFGTNLASYSRTIARQIALSFEFLYLMSQVVAATGAMSYWQYIRRGENAGVYIPFQSLAYIVSGACLFLMDASRTTRVQKGLIMTISALGMALYAFLWNRDSSATAEEVIDLYVFQTMIKTLVSTPLAVCSFFALKYAASSLFLKHDAMMLKFAPRTVKLSDLEFVIENPAEERTDMVAPGSAVTAAVHGESESTAMRAADHTVQTPHSGASAYAPDEGMAMELSESATAAAKRRKRTNTLLLLGGNEARRARGDSFVNDTTLLPSSFSLSSGAVEGDQNSAAVTTVDPSTEVNDSSKSSFGLSGSQEPEELKLRYRNRGKSLKISRHYSAARSASTLESSSEKQQQQTSVPKTIEFMDDV